MTSHRSREMVTEIPVGDALARRLIDSQMPTLGIESLGLLAEGWDNTVWLVNGEWTFRFPRHERVVPGFEREMALLPRLAPLLPLPVPIPQFRGHPSPEYPWPFSGARLLPGRELAESGLPDAARVGLAREIGSFLRRLHAPDLAQEFGPVLPSHPERTDMAQTVPEGLARLAEVTAPGLWSVPLEVTQLLQQALTLPVSSLSVLVHGDLHVRHALVDQDGHATGIIDWGDISLAHPSVDLQIGWSGFAGEARSALLAAYGPIPDEWRLRARVSALFYSASLATLAHRDGLAALEREARSGLRRACTE